MANNGSVVRKNLHDLSKPIELRELNRQLDWMWKKILGGLTAKDFSDGGMKSVIKTVEKTVAEEIAADSIETNVLVAALAEMMVAKIGVAKIDYAQIVDVFSERIFTDAGIAGHFRMEGLEVTQAQIVDLIVSSFRLVSQDGKVYKVSVDANGEIITEYVEDEADWMDDGKVPDGYSAVASSFTVGNVTSGNLYVSGAADIMKLTAKMLTADEAWIRELASDEILADSLMANEAFVELLRTSNIVSDKSLEMIVREIDETNETADELNRLSNIEVIEGTFVQADRREGEGIHVFGEFGPKQEGTPYPPGGGKNKFDVERASDIANWGKGSTWAYYELASTPGTYHFSYNPTVTRIDNFILNICRSTDGSSGDSLTLIYVDVSRTECTFELQEGERLYFNCFFGYGFTQANLTAFVEGALVEAQLELGTVTTPFEPYAGIFPVIGRNALAFEHLGKNLFNVDSQSSGGITVSKNEDGAYVLNGTAASLRMIRTPCSLPNGTYILSSSSLPVDVYVRIRNAAGSLLATNNQGSTLVHEFNGTPGICEFTIQSGVSLDNVVIQPQLECIAASTNTASPYEPYRRKSYTVEFSETVYGGKVDCYTGEVAAEWGLIESYAGEELPGEWLSDRDVYAQGATPTIGAQVVYKLTEPVKINASPAWPTTFDGINTIYIDAESGYVEFGHDLPDVIDGAMEPASSAAGAIWLDRSVTPAVLRRFNGSEWETLNDTTEIINAQNALQQQQQELKDKQAETDLFLKLDSANKVVRIGQMGVTSQYIIDAFGSGVSVNDEIFSRFEANRVLFGDMEMRKPSGVGGLAFDSITT